MEPQENTWKEMIRLERKMDRVLDSFLDGDIEKDIKMIDKTSENYRKAFTEYKEEKNEFVLRVELPGIKRENIKLNITDKGLEIKAEKEKEKEKKKDKEYSYTKEHSGFYQFFSIPRNADLNNIEASYDSGVLKIKILKKTNSEKNKTIKIR